MSELDNYRREIDQIDEQLTKLFEARMETVLKVGEYKKEHGIPVFDASREQKVIEKNVARLTNKRFERETAVFFQQMMDITKETQKKLLAE
jgi:monofunctional chorismate mutase